MLQSWSLPSKSYDDGRSYMDFPELSDSDLETRKRVDWWNKMLKENVDPELKVVGGAFTELKLTPKNKGY